MLRFSANISMMYSELPFLDRFAAAKSAGFDAVECWFPYEHSIGTLQALLRENDLTMVGINSAAGNEGEWGLAALPGRQEDFRRSAAMAIDYGQNLRVSGVHVMAGLAGSIPRAAASAAYLQSLEEALKLAEGTGVQLLIEPLNSRDRPGYFLSTTEHAAQIVARAGFEKLKIMFDCYHAQIEEGDLLTRLRRHWSSIGHIQIAAVPDRTEPDHGEIDLIQVCAEIERLGWPGWIGAEYRPRAGTAAGLGWRSRLTDGVEAVLAGRLN